MPAVILENSNKRLLRRAWPVPESTGSVESLGKQGLCEAARREPRSDFAQYPLCSRCCAKPYSALTLELCSDSQSILAKRQGTRSKDEQTRKLRLREKSLFKVAQQGRGGVSI